MVIDLNRYGLISDAKKRTRGTTEQRDCDKREDDRNVCGVYHILRTVAPRRGQSVVASIGADTEGANHDVEWYQTLWG